MAKKKIGAEGGANEAGEKKGFEELLAEAEALAERMEDGGMNLDDSLAAYEKGVANLKVCADLLREAEEKVKVLLERNGAFVLEDLDGDGEDDEDDGGDGGSERVARSGSDDLEDF